MRLIRASLALRGYNFEIAVAHDTAARAASFHFGECGAGKREGGQGSDSKVQ